MKKLIIAVAIMLVAVVSQAAAVTWTINNIQSSPDTTVGAGWLVALYSASTTFDYDDAKAGKITALDTTTSVASGTMFKATNKFGNFSGGADVSSYAVIFDAATIADAKNYIVSSVVTKSINAAGSDQTISFGNMGGTATTNMFLGQSWTAAAVPEPTSGLLLLLGMAGLALRRKRA